MGGMSGTQAKITGGGLTAVVIWLWNGCVVGPLGLPESMLIGGEAAVGLTLVLVALADRLLGTGRPSELDRPADDTDPPVELLSVSEGAQAAPLPFQDPRP